MSTVKATRSFRRHRKCALGLALFTAVLLSRNAGQATPTRSDLQHRQQMMESSADAANQRTFQQRDIADKQRQLLQYQLRKSRRMQQRLQCKAAGGALAC